MKQKLMWTVMVLALAGCGAEPEAVKEAGVRMEGETLILAEADKATFLKVDAVQRDEGGGLRVPGRLVWNEDKTVRVVPQLGGRLLRIQAEVGAPVRAGQPLAVLASPDYGQALADARKAQADLQLGKQALERNRQLHEAGVVAEKDWQQAQADMVRIQAEASRAAQRLASLGGDGDGSYTLKSPLAGVVVERNVNPGMEFRPDQPAAPLFVVTDPSRLWVQLDAGEADLAAVKPGQRFAIEVRQYPGERFSGVVRHIADFVDPVSRTVKIRGEVANDDRRLKGEMFVTALVELPPSTALRVPAAAVFLMGDRRYVLVEEGAGRYGRRAVQAGAERAGWIDILGGLQEGDKVVVEGNLNLIRYFAAAAPQPKAAAQ